MSMIHQLIPSFSLLEVYNSGKLEMGLLGTRLKLYTVYM